MNEESRSTRRSFLKGGAIVAAPLAALGAPAAAMAAGDKQDRLARLEDEKAIRALHADWMRHVGSGDLEAAAQLYASDKCACALAGVAAIAPVATGTADVVEVAEDGRKASARYAAVVETQALIAPEDTLTQMLHAQGEGYVRTSAARTIKADYVKTRDGQWAMADLTFETG
jgi:ketosteroid isomerase-like protein